MTSIENINLVSCDVVFENSGGEPIDTYHYNGITYNIDELKNKIIVQILNVYTQLVIFNTTGTFFEEHEKYAINKFCLINFDFVNSIYPALRQSIKKSLEIKE
jgi:hypothetical protein